MENRTTEQASNYSNLDKMSTEELLEAMNAEDRTVPVAVAGTIPQIRALVDGIVERVPKGGRVFYLGAGTSGTGCGTFSSGLWQVATVQSEMPWKAPRTIPRVDGATCIRSSLRSMTSSLESLPPGVRLTLWAPSKKPVPRAC